jgi:hypothetical protein
MIGGQEEIPPAFQHPLLRGKSPEEIERIFETQQRALDDVTREANELHSRVNTQPTAPTPVEQEEADPYGDDFLAPRFQVLERRVTKSLESMIAPLKEATASREGGSIRERLRNQYPKFQILEPHIDRLIREQGDNPATASEGQLRMLYHTALGVAMENGINLDPGEAPTPTRTPTTPPSQEGRPPVSIPQHRPSGAPLPKPTQPAKRELTENEKRLAREYFPNSENPEDDYRKLQSAEVDEVVEPGFSKEGW